MSISPLDDRYHDRVKELEDFFSESALMRYRLMIEVEYLLALPILKLPSGAPAQLRRLYKRFTDKDAQEIKLIEATTNHDVKAIEYFLKSKLEILKLGKYKEYAHFALTSEDVNNLAYSLMWQAALRSVYLPTLRKIFYSIRAWAKKYAQEPMLALTHGQAATPTTIGKEFAVFAERLARQIQALTSHRLLGKLNGATGTWSAHAVAYPEINWIAFSKKFVESLGLEINLVTTQIEPHDSLAENFHIIFRINTILLDFTRDVWMYISRGVLGQKKKAGEIGSSTMPHKINPINFENAEGNLGIANAYFLHLAEKLPISRLQRDLSDSTVLRNQGVPLAHSLIAIKNILSGLSRLTVNRQRLKAELDAHWEVLAEAIQTILRKVGHDKPYEKLKELTRGATTTKKAIQNFVRKLDIPKEEKLKLLKLTPQKYIGLAAKLSK